MKVDDVEEASKLIQRRLEILGLQKQVAAIDSINGGDFYFTGYSGQTIYSLLRTCRIKSEALAKVIREYLGDCLKVELAQLESRLKEIGVELES